jgi:hypothetical protein
MKRRNWKISRVCLFAAALTASTVLLAVPTWAAAPPPDEDEALPQDQVDREPQADDQRPRDVRRRDRFRDEDRVLRGDRGPGDRPRDGLRRGREGRGGPDDFRGPRDEMSQERIDEVMDVLRQELPQWCDRLNTMRERRPERFRRAMRRVQPVVGEYISLRAEHPELAKTILDEFRIEGQLRKLGRAFREARGDESRQAEIEREIAQLVQRQFEFKMHRREARMKEIEQRLAQEREKFAHDKASLRQQVKDRVGQITRGNSEDTLRRRDGEPRRERRDDFADRPGRRPQRRR